MVPDRVEESICGLATGVSLNPILVDAAPEAVAVTLIMVGEELLFHTPVLVDAFPKAVAVTLVMLGEDEKFSTPVLFVAAPEAVAVTF